MNSAALAWLDRTGNGTVHAVTKRIPREMFESESKKLAKYVPQNVEAYKQKIVTVSDLNTVVYAKNRYDVPVGMYAQGARLRVEDDGTHIALFDPITNELVIKHKKASGEGGIVKANIDEKQLHPEVEKVKKLYGSIDAATAFVDEIGKQKPRYVIPQCRMLKKIYKEYGKDESVVAITECAEAGRFDATEVLALLVAKHGVAKAQDIFPVRTKKHYAEKARSLAKYSELAEV